MMQKREFHILSAGAAQSVVEKTLLEFSAFNGISVNVRFGAVGAMREAFMEGVPCDLIVLTRPMIDEIMALGRVLGQGADLGKVGTGVAVLTGAQKPEIATALQLKSTIMKARWIVCPDPSIATAGKIVLSCLDQLGMTQACQDKLQYFPNGNAAMNWMVKKADPSVLGITQNSEILPIKGIDWVGPLPIEFQAKATYTAACLVGGAFTKEALYLMDRLTGSMAREMLLSAGFEI